MTPKALGFIETIGLAAAIEAADAAIKSANVRLLGYENARGGGRITVKLAGDVGAVKAAVSAGSAAALRVGRVEACLVIPRPHEEIEALIQQIDRGRAAQPALAEPIAQPAVAPTSPRPEKIRIATPKKPKSVSKVEKYVAPAKPKEPRTEPASSPAPAEQGPAQPPGPDQPEEPTAS
jgi:bacterial microcompartment shell protein